MDIDTDRVITEVQLRPIIWDTSLHTHKNRKARQAAWLDICHEIVDNFKHLSRNEKNEIEQKIQARWKTARDSYVRAKAMMKYNESNPGAKKGKIYIYYNMLTFLDRPTDIEDSLYSQEESTHSTSMEYDNFQSRNENRPSTSVAEMNSFNSNEELELIEESRKGNKRKQNDTDFEKEIISYFKRKTQDSLDDDWAYFHSIMPTIKKFTTYKKLKFRSKIINYLIDLEEETLLTTNVPT